MDLPSIGQRLFGPKKLKDNKGKFATSSDPEEVTKLFVGRKKNAVETVAWELMLQAMYTGISPNEILLRTSYAAFPQNIWLTLKLKDYPQILNCSSGNMLKVEGQIQTIQGEDIYLENCQVEFLTN